MAIMARAFGTRIYLGEQEAADVPTLFSDSLAGWDVQTEESAAFVAFHINRAIAAEREACAKLADGQYAAEDEKCLDTDGREACKQIATAIRQRG